MNTEIQILFMKNKCYLKDSCWFIHGTGYEDNTNDIEKFKKRGIMGQNKLKPETEEKELKETTEQYKSQDKIL